MKLGTLLGALGMLILVGCSSTPKSTDQLAGDSRSQYITDVRDTLKKWDDRAEKMSGDRASDVRAAVSDARAELRSMESAPSDNWDAYRTRINNRLDRIQSIYNQAR
jgi:outer membrane murein-binding lipoprotein Lpp